MTTVTPASLIRAQTGSNVSLNGDSLTELAANQVMTAAADVGVAGAKPLHSSFVPTTAELQSRLFKPGAKVRLVDDIPGHPAGARGKVALANGITWKRYWVRFPDGSSTGHVSHELLVSANDYSSFLVAREREAIAAAEATSNLPAIDAAAAGDDTAADSDKVVNGVTVPQHLLDMSAAARIRLNG